MLYISNPEAWNPWTSTMILSFFLLSVALFNVYKSLLDSLIFETCCSTLQNYKLCYFYPFFKIYLFSYSPFLLKGNEFTFLFESESIILFCQCYFYKLVWYLHVNDSKYELFGYFLINFKNYFQNKYKDSHIFCESYFRLFKHYIALRLFNEFASY